MGERKGTNKYYPPDFDPRLHRSLDAYHGTHALRERAKKVKQGIIVIRFEMPYNIWCGGCGRHVAMGVRYNAEKKKVGMYYSTPVYEFDMKCHLCDQHYIIRTDPGNFDYTIISGARRKEQRWDPTENGQIAPEDGETKRRLATDAMYRLEYAKTDEQRVADTAPRLSALAAESEIRRSDDIQLNRLVRAGLRDERKRLAAAAAADADVLARHSLTGGSVQLLPECEEDTIGAQLLQLGSVAPADAVRPSRKRQRSLGDEEEERSQGDHRAAGDGAATTAFGSAEAARPEELRQRTGKSRRLMGIVVGGGRKSAPAGSLATSSTEVATSSVSAMPQMAASSPISATAPTVESSSISATFSAAASSSISATSPTVASSSISATSSTVASSSISETSSTVASSSISATSSTVASSLVSATSPTVASSSISATSSTVASLSISATSSTVASSLVSATSPTVAVSSISATSSTVGPTPVSATSSMVASSSASGLDEKAEPSFGSFLVQYSATPSPASSNDEAHGED